MKRTLSGNVSLVRGGSDLEKKERMQLRPHRISGLRKKIAHSASHWWICIVHLLNLSIKYSLLTSSYIVKMLSNLFSVKLLAKSLITIITWSRYQIKSTCCSHSKVSFKLPLEFSGLAGWRTCATTPRKSQPCTCNKPSSLSPMALRRGWLSTWLFHTILS